MKNKGHFHLGGLLILLIIIFVLLKVDIKTVVNSPQFQQNASFVKEQATIVWSKYLKDPLTRSWNGLFNKIIDKGVDQIKDEIKIPIASDVNINLEAPTSNIN